MSDCCGAIRSVQRRFQPTIVYETLIIQQAFFELLDHVSGLLNGDFDAPKFLKLIRFKLFGS